VFSLTSSLLNIVFIACVAVQGWALIDCATRQPQAFVAASKLTKPVWLAITAVSLVIGLLFSPLSILQIAGMVASIVYLVDVRPAVKEVQGGGRW
jgi:Protein of unknown function (DUF2516)